MKFILSFLFVLFLISIFTSIWASSSIVLNQEKFVFTKYSVPEIKVSGSVDQFKQGTRLILTLVKPDNTELMYDVRATSDGKFQTIIKPDGTWNLGTYVISGKYGNEELGTTNFELVGPDDFRKTIATKSSKQTVPSNDKTIKSSSKIPEWIKQQALLFGQNKISDDEYLKSIQSLVDQGLVIIKRENSQTITNPDDKKSQSTTKQPTVNQFPDPTKDPQYYIDRYNKEPKFREWFNKNFPNKTIYSILGLQDPAENQIKAKIIKVSEKTNSDFFTNSNFKKVLTEPDKYTGKWVKLSGRISQDPFEYENGLSMVFDLNQGEKFDFTQRVWLLTTLHPDLKEDDCLIIDGKISGSGKSTNAFGAEFDLPIINLEKWQKISCLDAQYPANTILEINQSKIKGNIKVTLDKIELASSHTRAFVRVENLGTSCDAEIPYSGSLIIQNKKQFKEDVFNFLGPTIDRLENSIPPGVEENGVLIFDPISVNPLTMKISVEERISSDCGWLNQQKYDFVFDIKM